MYLVLGANNINTDIRVIGVGGTQPEAQSLMYNAFVKDITERGGFAANDTLDISSIPRPEDILPDGWSYEENGIEVNFSDMAASVLVNGDLSYYQVVHLLSSNII